MFIDFLVEEESAEIALGHLVPLILGNEINFRTIRFQGKHDLLRKLPDRLKGYSTWLPDNYKIVVLVDEDRQNCLSLKQELESAAAQAGLITKSTQSVDDNPFQVLNRIAVEELESWFFGDTEALQAAYPKVPHGLQRNHRYRNPDAISGGTWEALERILQRSGYFQGGLLKMQVASDISQNMVPKRNRSHSFQIFCDGLLALQS